MRANLPGTPGPPIYQILPSIYQIIAPTYQDIALMPPND
jgi:hypothetical protein